MTCDTVVVDTPAVLATSLMVAMIFSIKILAIIERESALVKSRKAEILGDCHTFLDLVGVLRKFFVKMRHD